jgi:hypothetical protein
LRLAIEKQQEFPLLWRKGILWLLIQLLQLVEEPCLKP